MFGTSIQSYNNIFGGLQESHKRQFGGDRMLTTKDIEGAQPRHYNRHVWGNHQPSSYQNPLSYEPKRSSIKSTILGDNVQPLNRGIPNSSILLFRDPEQNASSQILVSNQSQLNNARSPQSNQVNQTEPTPKMNEEFKNLQNPMSSRNQQLNLNFSNVVNDPKSQQQQVSTQQVKQNADFFIEKGRRNIQPPSQLKEQNIFSHPDYSNRSVRNQANQKNNQAQISNQKQVKDYSDVKEKMDKFKAIYNRQPGSPSPSSKLNVMNSARSPDAYIAFDPTPKDYKRESISSSALGILNDPVVEKYVTDKQSLYQQPCKSPVFKQNRNYGPDEVLNGPLTQDIRSLSQHQTFSQSQRYKLHNQQNISSSIQLDNIENQSSRQEQNVVQTPSQQQLDKVRTPYNNQNAQQDNAQINNERQYQDITNVQQQIPSQYSQQNFKPNSNNDQIINQLLSSQSQLQQSLSPRLNDMNNSQYPQKPKSVLSASAQMLLNQSNIQQNINNDYGLNSAQNRNGADDRNNDDYLGIKQQESNRYSQQKQNFDYIMNNNPEEKDVARDLKRSGKVSSPIAGLRNKYTETNKKFNILYHYETQSQPNEVKFFGAKALKNLSNIKLY